MVYGPGQQDETKLVPYVIRCLLQGKVPEITRGTHRIDWIFVDDVVSGFIRMAITPDVDGKSVDLGSGTLITIRELVDKICALMGTAIVPAYGALPDRPLEPLRIANVAESQRALGWSPTVGLAEGLRRTIDWYRELG